MPVAVKLDFAVALARDDGLGSAWPATISLWVGGW